MVTTRSNQWSCGGLPIFPSTKLDKTKAKIMEMGRYLRKRVTGAGSPLYLTKRKGKIRGIQVTRAEARMAIKIVLFTRITDHPHKTANQGRS